MFNRIIVAVSDMFNRIAHVFDHTPIDLAIVRRYQDANGAYVGELYQNGRLIGCSLDSLPLDWRESPEYVAWTLDTRNDFLAVMSPATVRVGALDPRENDGVRRRVTAMPRKRMTLVIQNRFIEYVMESKTR